MLNRVENVTELHFVSKVQLDYNALPGHGCRISRAPQGYEASRKVLSESLEHFLLCCQGLELAILLLPVRSTFSGKSRQI